MRNYLQKSEYYTAKNQPAFIYDIKKSWEEVIKKAPVWKSNKFPPLSKQKKYSFLGRKLISPIVIAAGPASGHHWTDFYFKMGFGAVIEKTRRTSYRPSNKAPNIAIVKSEKPITRSTVGQGVKATSDPKQWTRYMSMTNSFGNPSPLIETWANELKLQKMAAGPGQMLGCSVTATFPEGGPSCFKILGEKNPSSAIVETALDLLTAASAAVVSGADFVEFNLACPNVTENAEEGEMFQNEKLVEYVFSEFKKRFPSTPVGFKFGLYKSREQMKKVFKAAGKNLDYVSGVNAVSTPVSDDNGKDILPGRSSSGVCGRVMKEIALEEIRWADEIRKEANLKYEILGGGGVILPSDADEFLKAGADAVQVASIALANPLFAYDYRLHKIRQK